MFKNSGVRNGVYLGVASIVYSHVCYLINPRLMLNVASLFVYVIVLYFMYRATVDEKAQNEGYLSFGEALKVTFLTYVVGTFISSIYVYIMYNVVDPGLMEVAREVSIESAEFVTKLLGGNEEQLDQMYDQLESENLEMSFSMIFLNYLISLIIPGFIIAIIMSAIRKNPNADASLDG